jgi:ATP-dependent exoDNAse (exonuclease V) alpha subunit
MSNYIMLDNQWLYTAITRAKKGIFIIGEEEAFEKACTNVSKRYRNTWLKLSATNKVY